MAKFKPIKPLFLYDKNRKPILVSLPIADFERFMNRLQKLSDAAKKRENAKKKAKKL